MDETTRRRGVETRWRRVGWQRVADAAHEVIAELRRKAKANDNGRRPCVHEAED